MVAPQAAGHALDQRVVQVVNGAQGGAPAQHGALLGVGEAAVDLEDVALPVVEFVDGVGGYFWWVGGGLFSCVRVCVWVCGCGCII